MAASSPEALSSEIDVLLEQYLSLLDQYDTLRKSLSTLQISVQQNIARANFDAPRGVRYGEELYDARMQASRVCSVIGKEEKGPVAVEVVTAAAMRPDSESTKTSREGDNSKKESGDSEEERSEGKATKAQPPKPKDSIRMFGILTPRALRVAQGSAVQMVEDIIPKLVSVDAQMKEVEIKIRRARKHRAKAEFVDAKTGSAINVKGREALASSN